MNAFGKRNGLGQRPSFGVARPMKGGQAAPSGGDQFPPVEDLPEASEPEMSDSGGPGAPMGAMDRLNSRQNASTIATQSATTNAVPAISMRLTFAPTGCSHQAKRLLVHGTR